MDTATAACADFLNMDAADLVVAVPAPVKSAALLMVAGLYENREDVSDRQLYRNDTYYRLLRFEFTDELKGALEYYYEQAGEMGFLPGVDGIRYYG